MKKSSEVTRNVLEPVLYIIGYLVILLFLINFLTNSVLGEDLEPNTDQYKTKITLNKAE